MNLFVFLNAMRVVRKVSLYNQKKQQAVHCLSCCDQKNCWRNAGFAGAAQSLPVQ